MVFICLFVFLGFKDTLLAEHGGNPSTWEVRAGKSGFQGLSQL